MDDLRDEHDELDNEEALLDDSLFDEAEIEEDEELVEELDIEGEETEDEEIFDELDALAEEEDEEGFDFFGDEEDF